MPIHCFLPEDCYHTNEDCYHTTSFFFLTLSRHELLTTTRLEKKDINNTCANICLSHTVYGSRPCPLALAICVPSLVNSLDRQLSPSWGHPWAFFRRNNDAHDMHTKHDAHSWLHQGYRTDNCHADTARLIYHPPWDQPTRTSFQQTYHRYGKRFLFVRRWFMSH